MPSLLVKARAKTITSRLFDKVLDELAEGGTGIDSAHEWWDIHRTELMGLSIAEAINIFNNAKKKKNLAAKYDELVTAMSWKEKIEFLEVGVDELRNANSKKLRTMALVWAVLRTSPKIISVIMAVV